MSSRRSRREQLLDRLRDAEARLLVHDLDARRNEGYDDRLAAHNAMMRAIIAVDHRISPDPAEDEMYARAIRRIPPPPPHPRSSHDDPDVR